VKKNNFLSNSVDFSTQPLFIGGSQAINDLREDIKKIKNTDITVIILGDTGTGKSLFARLLHNNSIRRNKPFVKIDCANIPQYLLESELFGYKQGSFTGAWKNKIGRFAYANHGTVFLDEISEMPINMQSKLLHVLQDSEFTPIGGLEAIKVDVRIIAATNSNLERLISSGKFRLDLYYRLAVLCFHLPSLKERKEDVLPLINYFLEKYCSIYRKDKLIPSAKLLELCEYYDWPGNVRELENMIRAFVVLGSEEFAIDEITKRVNGTKPIRLSTVDSQRNIAKYAVSLREASKRERELAEKDLIRRTLDRTKGDKKKTADLLQVSYKCILKKIKLYRL